LIERDCVEDEHAEHAHAAEGLRTDHEGAAAEVFQEDAAAYGGDDVRPVDNARGLDGCQRTISGVRNKELARVEEYSVAASKLLECRHPEADPGGTTDSRVSKRLLDSLFLRGLGALLLLGFVVEHLEATAKFVRLIELFHHSEESLLLTLLFEIDWRLVAEAGHQESLLNDDEYEGQGPDDAEVRVDIEVIIGVYSRLDVLRVGKGECAWQGDANGTRELIDGAKRSKQFSGRDLIDHLGRYDRERSIGDAPDEAADAHDPDLLANEGDANADGESNVKVHDEAEAWQ